MGQMGQMMKQAQMMQMNIQKAQKELETIEVTGEAGNGMVKVTMTCKNVCRRVMIDDSLVGADADREMLEDLLLTAINDASKKVEAETNAKIDRRRAAGPSRTPKCGGITSAKAFEPLRRRASR